MALSDFLKPTKKAQPKVNLGTVEGLKQQAEIAGLGKRAEKILATKGERPKEIFSGGFISDTFDVLNTAQYGVVGLLKGNEINYLKPTDERDPLTYADKTSRQRAIHFAKHGFGKGMSIEKFQILLLFGYRILSLLLKGFFYKTQGKSKKKIN